MKLEKVVSRPKKAGWVLLFIFGLAIVGTMATSYNFEIVQQVKTNFLKTGVQDLPLLKIILGALGFSAILSAFILFFIRLLREMKISQIQADFLDRISHELRTPLSTLTLVSDILKSQNLTPEETVSLWHSHELELIRLKGDVELLLQAARLRESKLKVDLHAINLEDFLKDKWGTFTSLLGQGAQFQRQGPPLNGYTKVDPALFELILRNLLDNARKFSMDQPVVQVKTEVIERRIFSRKKHWRLSVIDHGLGFSPENQRWLFKRFSRLPFVRSDLKPISIPGTGLGLYLSATASRAMGLTLRGNSLGEGQGAEFILEGEFV